MTVKKIMSHTVVTVKMDDDLSQVRELFEEQKFHHLLVTDNGRLVGIISDRDILKTVSPYVGTPAETTHDTATLNKRAHQIMSRNPVTVGPDSELFDAVELFNHKGVSCLPVVDDQFQPIGIVTWRDILKTIEVISRKKQQTRH
ncbi:CBS domain-containing protein [Saccharospirillum salsuginis]|uniref:CBS domain-containing protein n=1 Tax=Saccharospirillum salsuginis TaxID=418750 RepID=A0A918KLV5_9GAMM|nr:CBS domain-containing protein [Saccharospirillum salsuginis]GGX68321.1 CBS domain-containing protein [Saccharospirillum salsuginis]